VNRQRSKPGTELRAIREQLGLSLRDVHAASVAFAKKHRQPAFVIPPSRLHEVERKNKIRTIHRLYTLALIYRRSLKEVLSFCRIPL
jgi:transcriptional regulator with XRE-family HTH domain